jgi:hypothetical protein
MCEMPLTIIIPKFLMQDTLIILLSGNPSRNKKIADLILEEFSNYRTQALFVVNRNRTT